MSALFKTVARATKPLPADDGLRWEDIDDLGVPGWCIQCGFTVDREPGDAPSVWIHKLELNTGQRSIPLALNEVDVNAFEAELSERIEIEDRMAAEHLAPDPGDFGDWEMEQRRDRES